MQANQEPNAEGEISGDNLSFEGLTSLLMKGNQDESEQSEGQPEEVDEQERTEEAEPERVEATEETEGEEATEETEEESETEIDLLSLAPEQIQELAKKAKSRLLQDVGKLRAENRALVAKMEELGSKQSAVKEIPKEQNPFGTLETPEAIRAKYEEFEQTLETTDRLLEEYEDYGPDDIIEVGSQAFSKKQIRIANRNAKDAIVKYLPAQAAHLQKLESYKTANQQWTEMAKQEVPEIADEKSEVGKAYSQLIADPLVKQLKDKMPELGIQIEYLLAHAARSKFGSVKKVAQGAGAKLKVKPPASPVGAGAQRTTQNQNGKYAEAMKRFEASGSADDWVAAQMYKG